MIDIRLSDCIHLNWKGRIGNFITRFSPSHRVFSQFWKQYIPTGKRYHSLQALRSDPPVADVYLVGSDQVWNPDITRHFATLYFLDFGPNTVRRVSYASSFGTETWQHPELTERVHRLLSRFSAVSCREQAGVEILHDTFDIEACNVLDPTLLLDDYSTLTGPLYECPTLVYYPLSVDPDLEKYAQSLAGKLGLKAVNVNSITHIFSNVSWKRTSPEEWVRGIAMARFVVTRSFHGMTMALLHKRQFAVVSSPNGRNSRLTGLLARLGLSDRFFTSFEDLEQARPWDKPIDYECVMPRLKQLRAESLQVLESMLAKNN